MSHRTARSAISAGFEAATAIVAGASVDAEVVEPGVIRVPLTTPTLPPATETNHYLVGDEVAVIVDPSTPSPNLRRALVDLVESLQMEASWRFQALFLTHHHNDHAGAAAAFAERLALPIWAHRETAARLPNLQIDRLIADGEVVARSIEGPWRAVFTPGHAPGHLVLHREGGGMIAGDMVAGEGTILIDPHEGSMSAYLASLQRMRDLDPAWLGPAHGPILHDADELLDYYRHHRLERESLVVAALTTEYRADDALLPDVYADVPRYVWPIALRSLRAHLIHLAEQGLAQSDADNRWRAT